MTVTLCGITIIRLWVRVGDHYSGEALVDGSMSQGWVGPEAVSQDTAVVAKNVYPHAGL